MSNRNKSILLSLLLFLPVCFSFGATEKQIFNSAAGTSWFYGGSSRAPHAAYVVMEPNCYYCRQVFMMMMPYIKSEKFAARWIVTAFLRRNSPNKAAAILTSENKFLALVQNEMAYDTATGDGGIQDASSISKRVQDKLLRNNRFISRYGFGTPVIIFRDRNNNYHVYQGSLSSGTFEDMLQNMAKF